MGTGRRFDGAAVLVAGGGRGIGAAVAQRLAAEGAAVALGCRSDAAAAQRTVDAIVAEGGRAVVVAGDIAEPGVPARVVRSAHDALGRLDALVNAAGIGPYRPLAGIDDGFLRAMFDTNVLGAMMLTRAAAEVLPRPGGRIVHLASRLAYNPLPGSAVYAASKAAVIAFAHGVARELGPTGITVNAVAPGLIETDTTAGIIAERGPAVAAMTPLGRIGQPGDIAGIVAFLLSADAGWITGRTIVADGGLN